MRLGSFAIMMLLANASDTQQDSHRVMLSRSKQSREQKQRFENSISSHRSNSNFVHTGSRSDKVISGKDDTDGWTSAPIKPIWERIKGGDAARGSKRSAKNLVKQANGENYELFEKAYNYFERIEAKENAKKSHPKVELDSQISITNHLNIKLHGPLVMGSNH
jgi:hypothetical protein